MTLNDAAYSTIVLARRKGRNLNKIWFLTKILHWTQIDVSMETIKNASDFVANYDDHSSTLDDIFKTNDTGIKNLKSWCQDQCLKKWHYEPSSSFFFQRREDAALFKLWWC